MSDIISIRRYQLGWVQFSSATACFECWHIELPLGCWWRWTHGSVNAAFEGIISCYYCNYNIDYYCFNYYCYYCYYYYYYYYYDYYYYYYYYHHHYLHSCLYHDFLLEGYQLWKNVLHLEFAETKEIEPTLLVINGR